MASTAVPVQADQRAVFHDVRWETYLGLLKARGEGAVRLTYHRGVLEIMTLSQLRERWSRFLHRFVVETTQELGLEVVSAGSTTMHAEELQSGAEADESYYIRHEEIVREREEDDPAGDPPPDLAVEVDLSSSSSRRLRVYAELGIPGGLARRWLGQRPATTACWARISRPRRDHNRLLGAGLPTPPRRWPVTHIAPRWVGPSR